MTEGRFDVVAVGEVMGLLSPDSSGPLEDVAGFELRVAGAEGNVLINLAQLGHRTALVSAVGADPVGRLVVRTLVSQGVNVDSVVVDATRGTGMFLKERLAGDERRVYYYRDGSAASRLDLDRVDLERLGVPRVLTVSGMTLGLGDGTGIATVAREMLRWAAEDSDCVTVFDPNLRPGLWDADRAVAEFPALLPLIDVLLTGADELTMLMPGRSLDDAAQSLCRGGLRAVVVKHGAQGAVVHEGGRITRIHPFPVSRVVDTVGAGDAFAAGVISGLMHGWSVRESAKVGAVLGARAVTITGDWDDSAIDPTEQLRLQYDAAMQGVQP